MRHLALACMGLAACVEVDASLDRRFDVCAPIEVAIVGADAAQRDAITRGLASWRTQGVSGLAVVEASGGLTIRLDDGAAAFHGLYDDEAAVIYVNRALALDALAIVVSHELGHAFGLAHVAAAARASVMNPGNLLTAPTDADGQALTAVWGACPIAPIAPTAPVR